LSSSAHRIIASALLLVARPSAGPAPQRLAIYYGYPSLMNGARGDLGAVMAQLAPYDDVLGDGLEFDTPMWGTRIGRARLHVTLDRRARPVGATPRRLLALTRPHAAAAARTGVRSHRAMGRDRRQRDPLRRGGL
jgi:hypothetical protein